VKRRRHIHSTDGACIYHDTLKQTGRQRARSKHTLKKYITGHQITCHNVLAPHFLPAVLPQGAAPSERTRRRFRSRSMSAG
jgi:hypothetical protein